MKSEITDNRGYDYRQDKIQIPFPACKYETVISAALPTSLPTIQV